MLQLQSALGLVLIPLLAWLLSEQRQALTMHQVMRLVLAGLGLQLALAALMLNIPALHIIFDGMAAMVQALQNATNEGTKLVFGHIAGGDKPYEITKPHNSFVLALQALPLVLLVSVLSKLFYHWGILQKIVGGVSFVLSRSLGVSGAVGTSAAANIFIGLVEAPLLIKPYLATMSRNALFATMTVGMSTVAGTVLALYASVLGGQIPDIAGHLLVASVISAPAALMLAMIMVPAPPQTEEEKQAAASKEEAITQEELHIESSMDAISQGITEGMGLLASIVASLIVFVALIALLNAFLGFITTPLGFTLTIEQILGWLFAPLAFIIGIPWAETGVAGSLIGIKTSLNELIAYLKLAATAPEDLSERSRLLLTYALCGFANPGSLGIMIGGLSAMAPNRRSEIISLGLRSIIAGTLATLLTAAVIGVLTVG